MDKELFRKTEGMLYGYYKDKKLLESVKKEIETVKELIKIIEKNITTCNISIDPYQSGTGEGERVQTSSNNSSYVEKAIIKAIDDMEKEKAQRTKKLYKLLCRERDLVYSIEKLDNNIGMLNDECKRFLELKYNILPGEERGIREIAFEMNMSKNRAYELREELVKNIYQFNTLKFGTK